MKRTLLLTLSLFQIGCMNSLFSSHCKPDYKQFGDSNFSTGVLLYKTEFPSTKSLIIIPPTGSTNYIDKSYAEKFCRNGYDVYVVDTWTGYSEKNFDMEIHQRTHSGAQKSVSLILDQIKTPFIGLLGTSLGGIYSSTSAHYQDRINAVFVITAGTPISEVIATSDQEGMLWLKSQRKKHYDLKSDEDNIQAINRAFTLEPKSLGDGHKKKDLGMVIAEQDTTVTTKTQEQLAEFWKPKKVIRLQSGHFWGIVKTWLFKSDELIQFFDESAKGHLSKLAP